MLDLMVIFLAGVLAKRNENGRKPVAVRIYSAVFSMITILLICSAMSKMIMYIGEYGLTGLRFYTSWFMILLGIVFLVLILHEIFPGMKTVATLFISVSYTHLDVYKRQTNGSIMYSAAMVTIMPRLFIVQKEAAYL